MVGADTNPHGPSVQSHAPFHHPPFPPAPRFANPPPFRDGKTIMPMEKTFNAAEAEARISKPLA